MSEQIHPALLMPDWRDPSVIESEWEKIHAADVVEPGWQNAREKYNWIVFASEDRGFDCWIVDVQPQLEHLPMKQALSCVASRSRSHELLHALRSEVQASIQQTFSEIEKLEDDWDSEGSPSYSLDHLRIVKDFVRSLFDSSLLTWLPMISPATAGSIDVFFDSDHRNLLINFPRQYSQHLPTFFGRTSRGDTLSGTISLEEPREDLLAWLMKGN